MEWNVYYWPRRQLEYFSQNIRAQNIYAHYILLKTGWAAQENKVSRRDADDIADCTGMT